MTDNQITISVSFKGQEKKDIKMPSNASIAEVVKTLKDSGFLPSNISEQGLMFQKANGDRLRMTEKITAIKENSDSNQLIIVDRGSVIRDVCES